MAGFPRTMVGGISMPRMIIGTNWFVGFSHCTRSKDDYIRANVTDVKKMADIIEVFVRGGVDAIMGQIDMPPINDAVREAEDRTGCPVIRISTPAFSITPDVPAHGLDLDEAAAILDRQAALGTRICMPHESTTNALVDRCTREIRQVTPLLRMIRERGMVPGLSTHLPESIIYADETGIDVETYISIYNAMGFLMQVEVDWTARIIANAKKPVMTIKPFAAGQIRPLQGLAFVWSTLRDQDMVTVGTMSPAEAAECIDISLQLLERRPQTRPLQETRSKKAYKGA